MSRAHTLKFHRDDKRIKEINEFRIASGLLPLKELKRLCAACNKDFSTYALSEKRCSRCRFALKAKGQRYNV